MMYTNILVSLIVFLPIVAFSQPQDPSTALPEMTSCKEQIELSCSAERDRKDFRGLLACLAKNDGKLSVECKQELQRILQATRQSAPPGGGPVGALAGLAGPAAQVPSLSYDGGYSPGHNEVPSIIAHNANVSVPVFKTARDAVAFTLTGGTFNFAESVTLDSGTSVPKDLYRAEAGVQYSRLLAGQRLFGLRGSFGYNGDKIDDRNKVYSISANYVFPGENENRWVLMLFISNNSPFGVFIPVPGFFYLYKTPKFTGLFGVPLLSMQWTPVYPWSYSLSIFGPTLNLEAAYGPVDRLQVFTGFTWRQTQYMMSERVNEADRLKFEEKTIGAGARAPISRKLYAQLQTGYSFDRSVYAGKGILNDDAGHADVEAGWFLRWSLRMMF